MNISKLPRLCTILWLSLISAPVVADNSAEKTNAPEESSENFRFALPSHYAVTAHEILPEFNAASVTLAPEGRGDTMLADGEVERRTIRVQTLLAKHYPGEFAKKIDAPRKFLYELINTQLDKICVQHSIDSGVIRKTNGQVRINWWTRCTTLENPEVFRYERGRYFLSENGAYLISHINRTKNGNHRYDRNEVKWFDKYLYNSGFCTTGQDCGREGELLTAIFEQKQ